MNLKNKTKQELIEIVESQIHLAKAIEAKDLEITKLNERINAIKKENGVVLSEKLSEIKKDKEEQLTTLELEISSLKNKLKELEAFDELKKAYRELYENNEKLRVMTQDIIKAFQNHLKSEQASLDNTIELQARILGSLK